MGKGDIKTRKGKIRAGSYGKSRPRKFATAVIEQKPAKKKTTPKKTSAKKTSTKASSTAKKKTTAKKS